MSASSFASFEEVKEAFKAWGGQGFPVIEEILEQYSPFVFTVVNKDGVNFGTFEFLKEFRDFDPVNYSCSDFESDCPQEVVPKVQPFEEFIKSYPDGYFLKNRVSRSYSGRFHAKGVTYSFVGNEFGLVEKRFFVQIGCLEISYIKKFAVHCEPDVIIRFQGKYISYPRLEKYLEDTFP